MSKHREDQDIIQKWEKWEKKTRIIQNKRRQLSKSGSESVNMRSKSQKGRKKTLNMTNMLSTVTNPPSASFSFTPSNPIPTASVGQWIRQ